MYDIRVSRSNTMRRKTPKIICLCRIKNESWFLHTFLRCTELWADRILLADEHSTDNSREIASKYKKVRVLSVPDHTFDEQRTNALLIQEARKIHGPKILFHLDADELFTANLFRNRIWNRILHAPKGTEIRFSWACVTPDLKHYWEDNLSTRAYVDDGKKYQGSKFHSIRLPTNNAHKSISIRATKLFHFQFTDWQRMQSKHRWYQVFERIQYPQKSFVTLFRTYHHMYSIPQDQIKPIPNFWHNYYRVHSIDIFNIQKDTTYWWDSDILQRIKFYGKKYFRTEDIWDIPWEKIAKREGYSNTSIFKDPRSIWMKIIHVWLRVSQPFSKNVIISFLDHILEKYEQTYSTIR
jgi:hypothetical protein